MQDFISRIPAVVFSCVIQSDNTPRLVYISEACQALLGLSAAEILQHYASCMEMIYPDDLERFVQTVAEASRRYNEWQWEGRLKLNNTVRWVEIRAGQPLENDNLTYTGIILNIDDRKKQEEERVKKSETLFNRLFNKL